LALLVLAANQVARALRRDQHHVQVGPGHDLLVVDVEAVREQERRVLLDRLLDFLVELGLRRVGQQERHEAGAFCGFRGSLDGEAVFLRLRRGVAVRPNADHDVVARIAQVQRVGAPLAAIAEHRDLVAAERLGIHIFFHEQLHRTTSISILLWGKKKPRRPFGCGVSLMRLRRQATRPHLSRRCTTGRA